MPFRPISWVLPPYSGIECQAIGGLEGIAEISARIFSFCGYKNNIFRDGTLRKGQQVGCEWVAGKGIRKIESLDVLRISLSIVVRYAAKFPAEYQRMTSQYLRQTSRESIVVFDCVDVLTAATVAGES